ncbi:MAG: uncharacterized protein A8A55_2843, partial [Amphiamblys sp. WSBS2006]
DEESCKNDPCCLPNCRLKEGAQCSDKNDGCCRGCQVIAKDEKHVCRKARNTCQNDSYCDGSSGKCPPSVFKENGARCEHTDTDGSLCANGICTGKSRQCQNAFITYGAKRACYKRGGCSIVCEIPGKGCMQINDHYVDGTKCGYGGFCSGGECRHTFSGFVRENWVAILAAVVLVAAACFFYYRMQQHPGFC